MNASAEHEQFLPSRRPHGGASPRSSDSRQHWSLWVPLAALFGALCTLALVSSLGSSGSSQQLRWVLRGGEYGVKSMHRAARSRCSSSCLLRRRCLAAAAAQPPFPTAHASSSRGASDPIGASAAGCRCRGAHPIGCHHAASPCAGAAVRSRRAAAGCLRLCRPHASLVCESHLAEGHVCCFWG